MSKKNIYGLTAEETTQLRDAVYKIADATQSIKEINESMKSSQRWNGQADIAAVAANLEELCGNYAGGIGYFLKEL